MHAPSVATFLFTDIEGSTRLWEQEPERMHDALARHDAIAAACVAGHHGDVVKTTGDGIHAVFADPLDAVQATIAFQLGLADAEATAGIALRVRCGLNLGAEGRRGNDYFGTAVNRAARVMSAAHGGQILVSTTVAEAIRDRLPADVSLHDLGIVRLRDLANAEQIFQVVHPGLRTQFPALRSLASTPNNLPQTLTSFVGREREVAEVKGMLSTTRLLTLVGIGGLGKSRLSLQVAADVMDEYPDGVWFVELAPVADARLVPQAAASVMGVKEDAGHSVEQALARFAKDRCLLVVLDNCEHLVQACARLARLLLEAGPGIRILASSRERLNLRGETTYALAPLPAPRLQQHWTPDALTQLAAVQLFVDRARAVRPDFEITAANAAAVADICRRLDGIPLALELAAARVRAMSPEAIAERLTDRFRLLRGGDRTALPRQQTLRALIDWSFELLQPDEQRLFRRLAVFAGGFTLDAAEVVGGGAPLASADVLDLLMQLVEKSLVVHDDVADRYRMLETVRQYALEKLGGTDEHATTRTRHLRHFLQFVETASPLLQGPDQGRWLSRLDFERENFTAAHAWCAHAERGGEADLRLVRGLRSYFRQRGLLAMGLAATLDALGRADAQERNVLRCRALSDAAQFAIRMGRHDEALRYLTESLAIARELNDKVRIEAVLQPLSMIYVASGDLATAQALLAEALDLARALDNRNEIAAALSGLVQIHRIGGEFDAAATLCDQGLALAREVDHRESIAVGLLNRAMIALQQQRHESVADMLAEAHALIVEMGATTSGQCLLEVVAGLAAARADWPHAARFFGAAAAVAEQLDLQHDPADEAFVRQFIAAVRAALDPVAIANAEQEGRTIAYEQAMREVRDWLVAPAPVQGSPKTT